VLQNNVKSTSHQDWGVPDWRDRKAYEALKNLNINEFRWEFTRRHGEYRTLWSEFDCIRNSNPKSSEIRLLEHDFNYRAIESFGFHLYRPHHNAHQLSVGDSLVDPRIKCQFDTMFFPSVHIYDYSVEFDNWVLDGIEQNDIFVRIDPSKPIHPQCEGIEAYFKSKMADEDERWQLFVLDERPRTRSGQRHRVDKYPLYLRLLDARAKDREKPARLVDIQTVLVAEGEIEANTLDCDDQIKQLCRQARRAQDKIVG
jgi:hypothetical protein